MKSPRGMANAPGTQALIRSLTNPWEFSACIPDGARGTGCFSLKENTTISAGALGTCGGFYYSPLSNASFITDTANTTAVPVIGANWAPCSANASVIAQYAKARVISGGMRIRYIGPTQTDSGVLLLGIASGATPVANFNGATLTGACNGLMEYKICSLREGGEITWRPMDIVDTEEYFNTNIGVFANNVLLNRPYLVAIVYNGAVAGTYINCEVIYNYEGQYQRQQFLSGGVTNADTHAEVGWYESAINAVKALPQITIGLRDALVTGQQFGNTARLMGNGIAYARMLNTSKFNPARFNPRMLGITY